MIMTPSGRHNAALDALRGTAALLVVILHASGVGGDVGPPGDIQPLLGFITESGMALFFALSGYLIAGPFVRAAIDGAPVPSIRTYSIRRIMRILPTYYFVFVVSVVLIHPGMPFLDINWNGSSPLLNLHDWVSSALLVQMFDNGAFNGFAVLPTAWSLGIEMIFYIVVPTVFVVAVSRRRARISPAHAAVFVVAVSRRRARISPAHAAVFVVAVWAAGIALTLLLPPLAPHTSVAWASVIATITFVTPFAGSFAPGVLIAIGRTRAAQEYRGRAWLWLKSSRSSELAPTIVIASLVAAFAFYIVGTDGTGALANWRRQPEAIAAGVLLVLAMESRARWWHTAVRILAPVGTISYSLYLVHFQVLRELADHHLLAVAGTSGMWRWPAMLVVAIGASVLTAVVVYFLVERQVLRLSHWLTRRRSSPTAAVAEAAATAPTTRAG